MTISVQDFLKIQKKINIIDLRDKLYYNNNHIPGAINIPAGELLKNANKYLNKRETYYLYCAKGKTSGTVCLELFKRGFKTVNIKGGYEAWILEN